MKRNFQLSFIHFVFLFPGIMLVLIPTYGLLQPWPEAAAILHAESGQPLLVGVSGDAHFSTSGSTRRISRTYVLIPSVFTHPKTVTISQINSGTLQVQVSSHGAFRYLAWLFIAAGGIWLCFRPVQQSVPHDVSAAASRRQDAVNRNVKGHE